LGKKSDAVAARRIISDEQSLRSLACELKSPLINIARQAELAELSEFVEIQQTAEQALNLIDNYLLSAQSEYGQLKFDLEPVSIGSVLYEASSQLRPFAKRQNVDLVLDDRMQEPVMTHRGAMTAVLVAFGQVLMTGENGRYRELVLRSYKTREGSLGVGVFTDVDLSKNDLRQALDFQGKAQMPLAKVSNKAHVSLLIAENLCRAVGGNMSVKKMGKLRGFTTRLPRSEQLSFV
jgi:signal transduction histidine kinase